MTGVTDSDAKSLKCNRGQPAVVRSMLGFRSAWEAERVIGVADSDVESLKCNRGRRFYGWSARRRRINAQLQVRI